MNHLDRIARFAEDLHEALPGLTTDLAAFPSGAGMLDIRWGSRLLVLAYSPGGGYGVDEVEDDDVFGAAFRFGFPDFDSAADKILDLLHDDRSAGR